MEFTFTELLMSYTEIKDMLEDYGCDDVKNLNTCMSEDLSLWGDDSYDFLEKFIDKYHLNHDGFYFNDYFLSEGELFNSRESLKFLIYLPFVILSYIYELFLPNKKNIFRYFNDHPYEQKDLTFGDLIAWKLRGEFCLRRDLNIELRND